MYRVDGREKVTGTVGYTVNMELPGMLHAKVLRSELPHARLVKVDASKAEALPGVIAVLTRDDLRNGDIEPYYGPVIRDQPIVAIDKVRYVGDPIAAVAAINEDIAAEALELIEVEYEELPAVFDAYEAAQPGAPIIHGKTEQPKTAFEDTKALNFIQGSNIATHFKLRKGDVEEGFRQADYIFENEYMTPVVQHCHLEPHATVAQVLENGMIEVWTSTQNPSVVREQLSEIFKKPLSKIRVVAPPLGAGYGAKTYPKLEPITVALARKAKRPVRLIISREEVFLTITRHAVRFRLKTGVTRDGLIVARKCELYYDKGAYADIGPRTSKNGAYVSPGPYRIPNVHVDCYAVYTNKPPAGAYRGFGVPQVCWGYEQQMDDIAERLGMDPIELRLKNVCVEGDTFHTGETLHAVGIRESIERVNELLHKEPLEMPKESNKRRGRGLACMIKSTMTPSLSTAVVKMDEDGSVTVLTSTVEMGQGSQTVLTQLASHFLHIPPERVSISPQDTHMTPYDQSTSSSRSTFSMGNAIQRACAEVLQQLVEAASDQLEVAVDDLEVRDGAVHVKGDPNRSLTYEEIITNKFNMRVGTIVGRGEFKTTGGLDNETGQGVSSVFWFTGANGCEVEVDIETGQVEILRFIAVADCGKALNPQQCEGQIEGSVSHGLGHTFFEQLQFEAGQPLNPNFLDYQLPTMYEMPKESISETIETPHRLGPLGAFGVGETSIASVAPAIANAIYDAIGVRVQSLPITPEKVLAALKEKEGEELEQEAV